ncbi:hypothetical protein diail_7537 [Diaporthe ilicicola]|nr:hypothetical protein diail_7537 [Diaporthe ilicicola]
MRASKVKSSQRGSQKKSQPLDPVDLSRRLNIVIAERQLQDLQLGKTPQDSDPDLLKTRRAHDVRSSQKTAPPPNNNKNNSNKRSSPLAAPKASTRWVFRTKPVADPSPHDSTDSSATYIHVPRQPNAPSQPTATIRTARNQQGGRNNRDRPEHADKYTVVLEEHLSEAGRGRPGDFKEHCPPDWTQLDSSGPKPRRLQLLKRMSPISVLKLRLGGDTTEADEVSKDTRARCDNTLDGSSTGLSHRKSGVFSKLLH